MDLLIEAAPSYWAADDLHELPKALESSGEPDLFVRMAAFAVHLVRLLDRGDVDEVDRVLASVETVFERGDERALELVTLGLFEVLQNVTSHSDVDLTADAFRSRLGPASGEAWDRLVVLWSASEEQLTDGGPTETDYLKVEDPTLRLYFQTQTRALPDGRLISASQVLEHESGMLHQLRINQRRALRRLLVAVVAVFLVLAVLSLVL